ncbi:thioredoxin family protein [Desulforhopalus singaporensis]|uniref:Peroxiredoxin n=1 Tax=Desulforhopalus singaporensis TaxID=91360 RepID=A0A1H0NZM8_9BACT|nr:thioredoxin family protein [Desulforhopalus singaporensis]SDO97895.1 Peroxiredoxin [Desulforhopalus singaporensis]
MSLTPSTMQELGTKAPGFTLRDFDGNIFSLEDQKIDRGLLVIFMCNHCPYVIHIRKVMVEKILDYQHQGIAVVGINANDYMMFPEDAPKKMASVSQQFGYSFPYLVDEQQQVAKAYRAACTPDFFLYDKDLKLVYRGQFDGARPGNGVEITGEDLGDAVARLIGGLEISAEQRPSMGCNIKWKTGNEPDYFRR